MRTVLITVIVVLLVEGLILTNGRFDISAARAPSWIENLFLGGAMDVSVKMRAHGVKTPPLDDPEMVRRGFDHFREMCLPCHGAPGVKPEEFGQGLNPPAPELSEAIGDWSPAQVFWIVKHGIKFSGMPAFGKTHNDAAIWTMVAATQKLRGMTAEDYRRLTPADTTAGGKTMPM